MTAVPHIRTLLPDGSLPAESQAFVSAQVAQEAGQFAADAQAAQAAAEAARDAALAAAGYVIVGAGRPDIVGTLDPDIATRVQDATSGTVFRSTDGPQGAWEWQKRGSTWIVMQGDTGWRNVEDLLVDGVAPSTAVGRARVRRIGDVAHFHFKVDVSADGVSRLWTAPPGFQVSESYYPTTGVPAVGTSGGLGLSGLTTGNRPLVVYPGQDNLSTATAHRWPNPGTVLATGNFVVSSQWPATLPGTPA